MVISATELKTNLGKYLTLLSTAGESITITKNGRRVAVLSPAKPSGVDRLAAVLDPAFYGLDPEKLKKQALEEKYEITL